MARPLQGLIIPHPEITPSALSAADSTYTEQGPRPGILVPSGVTAAVLEATGTAAAGEALEITTIQGGYPPDATFAWRSVSTDPWLGWDTHRVLHGWLWVTRLPNGGALHPRDPHVCTTATGRVLMAVGVKVDPSTYAVDVSTLDAGGAWSAFAPVSTGTDVAPAPRPCLLPLPSGRVLLFHWCTVGASAQAIRILASDDDGVTWATIAPRGSPTVSLHATLGYTPGKLRAAYSAGEVVVFAGMTWNATNRKILGQWASDALGYVLSLVAIGDPTVDADRLRTPAIFGVPTGGFVLAAHDEVSGDWEVRPLGSAISSYTDADGTELPGFHPTLGTWVPDSTELVGWAGADGVWNLVGVDTTTTIGTFGAYSRDYGVTWYNPPALQRGQGWEYGAGGPFLPGNAGIKLHDLTATDTRGLVVWGCQATLAADTHGDDSILSLFSGGSTSLPYPALAGRDVYQWAPQLTWIGVELPDQVGWTKAGAGAAALAAGGLTTSTTANTLSYTRTDTTWGVYAITPGSVPSLADVMVVEVDVTPTSAGSTTAAKTSFTVTLSDGTTEYTVLVALSSTGYRLSENTIPTVLATVAVSTTSGIRLRVYLAAGVATIYHLAGGAQSGAAQRWVYGGSGTPIAKTIGPAAQSRVVFGHLASGTETATWRYVGPAAGSDVTVGPGAVPFDAVVLEDSPMTVEWVQPRWGSEVLPLLGSQFATPATLLGRRFAADRSQVTGASLRFVDGPTAGGDAWTSEARADYPVSRIHPVTSPSPSVKWRSIDSSTDQVIAWTMPEPTHTSRLQENAGFALYIGGANWKDAVVARWTGAAWSNVATLDLSNGLAGLPYVRWGDRIVVNAAGGAASPIPPWLHRAELAGCTIDLGGGVRRRILRSTSGRWSPTAAVTPELVIDGALTTDPSSGNCTIWRRDVAVFVPGEFVGEKLRIKISAVATVDGWLEAGVVMIGSFIPLDPPGWGRGIEHTPLVEVVDIGSGLRASRVLTPTGRRKTRKALSISWPEGVDTRRLYDAAETVASWPGSHDPRGTPYATGGMLAGLLEEIAGAHTPVVYVSVVETGSGTTLRYAMPGPDTVIYGRITTGLSRTAAWGWENESEAHHISEVVIEEEL